MYFVPYDSTKAVISHVHPRSKLHNVQSPQTKYFFGNVTLSARHGITFSILILILAVSTNAGCMFGSKNRNIEYFL